jgi:5'(3')-deoxyribonucleotidase
MNKKLLTLWDMDDVLFPLLPNWCKALNIKHNMHVKAEDITSWELPRFFPSLTEEEVFTPLITDKFWEKLFPYSDGPEVLAQVSDAGHRIKIVTATDYRNVTAKVNLLLRWYQMLSWDDVIITADKSVIKGDVITDDGVHNLLNRDKHKILMSRPHNLSFNEKPHGIHRVNNLSEAWEIIQRLVQEPCENYKGGMCSIDCLKCDNCYDDDGGLYCRVKGKRVIG